MIDPEPLPSIARAVADFWDLLEFFFDKDCVHRWKEIFTDRSDPNKALDGCHNMICINSTAHSQWVRGMFALRPVAQSEDGKKLTVQLYWQPKPSHSRHHKVDLLKPPASSEGVDSVSGERVHTIPLPGIPHRVRTGDILVFKTEDPKLMPLPSFELLDMQWHLTRIAAMSGVMELLDEFPNVYECLSTKGLQAFTTGCLRFNRMPFVLMTGYLTYCSVSNIHHLLFRPFYRPD